MANNIEDRIKMVLLEAEFVTAHIYPMCKKWIYKDWLICPDCGYIKNNIDHTTRRLNTVNFNEVLESIK